MNTLVLDVDQSLGALGPKENVRKHFGMPPIPITGGIQQSISTIERLFQPKVIKESHPLFGEFSTTTWEPTPLVQQTGIEVIALDTISHSFMQDKRILERVPNTPKTRGLEQRDWGTLERMYGAFFELMKGVPVVFIVNAHMKYDKDDTGTPMFDIMMQGGSKDYARSFFDIVLFTKADRTKKLYTWQTFADTLKPAKDRLGVLKEYIPQDFAPVLTAYADAGFPHPKILVIGDSGTGKSRALLTLPAARQKEN